MTFPTTDVRFDHLLMNLPAECGDADASLKCRDQRTIHDPTQLQMLTSIGLHNPWHRTGIAKISRPGLV